MVADGGSARSSPSPTRSTTSPAASPTSRAGGSPARRCSGPTAGRSGSGPGSLVVALASAAVPNATRKPAGCAPRPSLDVRAVTAPLLAALAAGRQRRRGQDEQARRRVEVAGLPGGEGRVVGSEDLAASRVGRVGSRSGGLVEAVVASRSRAR